MLRYVRDHSLQVGPITDLMGSKVACVGLGNAYIRLLGYMGDLCSGRQSSGL